MKSTMFELSEKFRVIAQAMSDGESDALTRIALEMAQSDLEEKAEAYTIMIGQFKTNIVNRKQTMADLQMKNDREQASIDYLEKTLKNVVKEFGEMKTTPTGMNSFELHASGRKIVTVPSQAVNVDENFINEEYGFYNVSVGGLKKVEVEAIVAAVSEVKTVKSTFVPDKAAIKEALKDGVEVIGAELLTNYSLKASVL